MNTFVSRTSAGKNLARRAFALAVAFFAAGAFAFESIPVISSITADPDLVSLEITNLDDGGSYSIERRTSLVTGSWTNLVSFAGFAGSTNWTDSAVGTLKSAYYRVGREAYHPKVGQTAVLTTRYHDVSGTATITGNDTITITDFNFDASGVDVRIIVSPNDSFSPYAVLTGNLARPDEPYVGETLVLPAPDSLDDVSWISVWCTPVGISFGDGTFE